MFSCVGLDARNQRLVTIIACVIMMLMGIFFVIFGYRIFRVRVHSAAEHLFAEALLLACGAWKGAKGGA